MNCIELFYTYSNTLLSLIGKTNFIQHTVVGYDLLFKDPHVHKHGEDGQSMDNTAIVYEVLNALKL